jgi:hypothetical protein
VFIVFNDEAEKDEILNSIKYCVSKCIVKHHRKDFYRRIDKIRYRCKHTEYDEDNGVSAVLFESELAEYVECLLFLASVAGSCIKESNDLIDSYKCLSDNLLARNDSLSNANDRLLSDKERLLIEKESRITEDSSEDSDSSDLPDDWFDDDTEDIETPDEDYEIEDDGGSNIFEKTK